MTALSPPSPPPVTDRHELLAGARRAFPIVIGYVPIGLAYGVLAKAAGLPFWLIVGMSVLVYAGSAQFLAVSLLGQGAAVASIVLTTFLVNMRHLLYSLALASRLAPTSSRRLAWVAAEVTDESFVIASMAARDRSAPLSFPFVAGLQGVAQLSWVAGSIAGGLFGSLIGDPARYGLDFALVAMFLGLLALQLQGGRDVAVAVIAAVVSLSLSLLGVGTGAVVLATVLACAASLVIPTTRSAGGHPGGEADRAGP